MAVRGIRTKPADEASRGMKAEELQDSRWIQGPEFLWSQECKWLNGDEQSHTLRDDDPEVKKSVAMATLSSDPGKPTLEERVERFSDWYRAQRAVALCMKYIKKLRARVKKEPNEAVQLRAQDLEKAGKLIIRAAQLRGFKTSIKNSQRRQEKKNSPQHTRLQSHYAVQLEN